MTLGEWIKNYRDTHSLSMQDMADMCGFSKAYIGQLEKGVNPSTGKPISPTIQAFDKIARAVGLDLDAFLKELDGTQLVTLLPDKKKEPTSYHAKGVRIPVLGRVAAGIPIEAIEDVDDWEEIPESIAKNGEYFALKIKGKSMEPRIMEGDVVIVRKQSCIDSGDVAIVLVNGNDATVKQVTKSENGITLIGWNPSVFPPQVYNNDQIKSLPIQILGKVIEVRGKL